MSERWARQLAQLFYMSSWNRILPHPKITQLTIALSIYFTFTSGGLQVRLSPNFCFLTGSWQVWLWCYISIILILSRVLSQLIRLNYISHSTSSSSCFFSINEWMMITLFITVRSRWVITLLNACFFFIQAPFNMTNSINSHSLHNSTYIRRGIFLKREWESWKVGRKVLSMKQASHILLVRELQQVRIHRWILLTWYFWAYIWTTVFLQEMNLSMLWHSDVFMEFPLWI